MRILCRCILGVLIVLGVLQIVYGFLLGGLLIETQEAPMWHDFGLSVEQSRTFCDHIRVLKQQWRIVGWLGIVTVIAAACLAINIKKLIMSDALERKDKK